MMEMFKKKKNRKTRKTYVISPARDNHHGLHLRICIFFFPHMDACVCIHALILKREIASFYVF